MFIFSYFHIYPIFQRTALYTLPLLIVFITKPFDYVSIKKKWYSLILSVIFLCAFWGYNPSYLIKFKNFNPLNFRSTANNARFIMKDLINHYDGQVCIVVGNASYPEYFYYSRYFNFKPKCFIKNEYLLGKDYLKKLNTLKNGEYWFFHSFDYTHIPIIPHTKEWASGCEIIYEYKTKDTYLLNMKKS